MEPSDNKFFTIFFGCLIAAGLVLLSLLYAMDQGRQKSEKECPPQSGPRNLLSSSYNTKTKELTCTYIHSSKEEPK